MATHSITFKGVDLEVEGNHIEGEPMQMYCSDMSGNPGSPDEFEIEGVYTAGSETDLTELIESLGGLEELETAILEHHYQ